MPTKYNKSRRTFLLSGIGTGAVFAVAPNTFGKTPEGSREIFWKMLNAPILEKFYRREPQGDTCLLVWLA
jgi:hypothetical protein